MKHTPGVAITRLETLLEKLDAGLQAISGCLRFIAIGIDLTFLKDGLTGERGMVLEKDKSVGGTGETRESM